MNHISILLITLISLSGLIGPTIVSAGSKTHLCGKAGLAGGFANVTGSNTSMIVSGYTSSVVGGSLTLGYDSYGNPNSINATHAGPTHIYIQGALTTTCNYPGFGVIYLYRADTDTILWSSAIQTGWANPPIHGSLEDYFTSTGVYEVRVFSGSDIQVVEPCTSWVSQVLLTVEQSVCIGGSSDSSKSS
jgi:hypothetical protein